MFEDFVWFFIEFISILKFVIRKRIYLDFGFLSYGFLLDIFICYWVFVFGEVEDVIEVFFFLVYFMGDIY